MIFTPQRRWGLPLYRVFPRAMWVGQLWAGKARLRKLRPLRGVRCEEKCGWSDKTKPGNSPGPCRVARWLGASAVESHPVQPTVFGSLRFPPRLLCLLTVALMVPSTNGPQDPMTPNLPTMIFRRVDGENCPAATWFIIATVRT